MRSQWLGLLAAIILAIPIQAKAQDFSYKIIHPLYGDIGTFGESITKDSTRTEINIRVRIQVKILGITVYREEGDRIEDFRGNHFISLKSFTVTNGTRIDVQGDVQGNHFVVTSPAGIADAPIDSFPSDPWLVKNLGDGTSIAIETGEILHTHITGGESVPVSLQGNTIVTRHFTASGKDYQYDVWLDDHNAPIMFRSLEDGTPIDFVLTSPVRNAAQIDPDLAPTVKLKPE